MIRSLPSAARPLRRARFALAAFLAAVCVTLVAPFVQSAAYDTVCSAQGTKRLAHDSGGRIDGSGDETRGPAGDHAVHCALCMPAGAPPSVVAWDFAPAQPLAHVQRGIPAARLAGLVGAPLPARGPPLVS